MAENLNEYFSSVFIREDISSLPAQEVKFVGRESDYLEQLNCNLNNGSLDIKEY